MFTPSTPLRRRRRRRRRALAARIVAIGSSTTPSPPATMATIRPRLKNFHYRELGELTETRNLYAMMINKYAGIVVLKDGFTFGDPSKFKEFIDSKYNDTKPWKE